MLEKLSEILEDIFGLDEGSVTEETRFTEDLCADSEDMQELFLIIEEEFDILTDDGDADNLETVADLEKYITEKEKEQH